MPATPATPFETKTLGATPDATAPDGTAVRLLLSLRGGSLLMTPLKGADGQVYAVAQGNLVIGGISASGKSGSSVQVNISNSGRVPNGATVERVVPSAFASSPTASARFRFWSRTEKFRRLAGRDAAASCPEISWRCRAPGPSKFAAGCRA